MYSILSKWYRGLLCAGLIPVLVQPAHAFLNTYMPGQVQSESVRFNGHASRQADRFMLTSETKWQKGAIILDNLPKTTIKEFNLRFGLRIKRSGSNQIADGFSFGFGPGVTSESVSDEKGINKGLGVAFDTYHNLGTSTYPEDPAWVPGISIRWNGQNLATKDFDFSTIQQDPAFKDVVIALRPSLTPGGLATVTVDYQTVHLEAQIPYEPEDQDTWRMIFAARTGELIAEHSIDRIEVSGKAAELHVFSDYAVGMTSHLPQEYNPQIYQINCDPSQTLAPGTVYFNGSSSVSNNLYVLTPRQVNRTGSMVLADMPPVSLTSFEADLGLRVYSGGGNQADGFSFNYGPHPADTLVGESGMPEGLSFCLDTYRDGPGNEAWIPGMAIKWNGVTLAGTNIIASIDALRLNTNFYQAVFSLEPVEGLAGLCTATFQYLGYTLSAEVPYSPTTNETWRVVLGARTGGSYSEHAVNHLQLTGVYVPAPVVSKNVSAGVSLEPPVGTNEILEKNPFVLEAPTFVYLDRFHRELEPTAENIRSLARYRARLGVPAATVTPSNGGTSFTLRNGDSLQISSDTTVTWHWELELLAEVEAGTGDLTDLSPTDITGENFVATLGKHYMPEGSTAFDSVVNRFVQPPAADSRFGSVRYVMENAPNAPEKYLELAGEGDHLRAEGQAAVLPVGSSQYTLEFWARPNSLPIARDQVMVSLGSRPGQGLQLFAGFAEDKGFFVSDGRTRISLPSVWTDASWHHWAVVCLGSGSDPSVLFYRDGAVVHKASEALAPFIGDSLVSIGARGVGKYSDQFYSGAINNFRVWGRALDRPEILSSMATIQHPAHSPQLLLEMPFDASPTNTVPGVHVEHLTGPVGITNITDMVEKYVLTDRYNTNNFLLPDGPLSASGQGTNGWHHRTSYRVQDSATYSFNLRASGPAQLWVDGQLRLELSMGGSRITQIHLPPGNHLIETWMLDTGGPRWLELSQSADIQVAFPSPLPDSSLNLAAVDLLAGGHLTVISSEGQGRVFDVQGFGNLFSVIVSGAKMLKAVQPGFQLGLTSISGGLHTVQIDANGKMPMEDWRRVYWGWDKEYRFKVGVACVESDAVAQLSKLPFFSGEVDHAKIDGKGTPATTLGEGVADVLEIWLREGEPLTVGTLYRTPDRRFTLVGLEGKLNLFGEIRLDNLLDGQYDGEVTRQYSFPVVDGPGRLIFRYDRTIHRVNLALGQGLDVSSLGSVNMGLYPELPVGSTNLQVTVQGPAVRSELLTDGSTVGTGSGFVWDHVGKKWYPTKPGTYSVTWPDEKGYTNTIQVTARFPTDPETRSGFRAFENKAGFRLGLSGDGYSHTWYYPDVEGYRGAPRSHYTYNVYPLASTSAPADLDPMGDDDWFFKELAYSEHQTLRLVDNRILTDTLPGNRSVLVFTRRPDARQVADGNLNLEKVAVRVLEAHQILNTEETRVGARLESPGDEAGFHSGYVTDNSKNYNPGIYDSEAAVGHWGPIYPVNDSEATDQPLVVGWYANMVGPEDPPAYFPVIHTSYDATWPEADDEGTPVIYISSQMGTEGVGQGVSTNGLPNYQTILDPSLYSSLSVYNQPDRKAIGYNPNEEHAFVAPSKAYVLTGDPRFNLGQGAAFALQNGLNQTDRESEYTSEPFVLLQYAIRNAAQASDAFEMRAYVVKTVRDGDQSFPQTNDQTGTAFDEAGEAIPQPANPEYRFEYRAQAGLPVSPPYPLNLAIGNVVVPETVGGNLIGPLAANPTRTLWKDKNGMHWVVSGTGDSRFFERFFYPLSAAFWMGEGEEATPVGTSVAWAPEAATNAVNNPGLFVGGQALPIASKYQAYWGKDHPVLKRGETLTYAGGEFLADHPDAPGLPALVNMASAELVFDSNVPSMVLTNSTDYSQWKYKYELTNGIVVTTYSHNKRFTGNYIRSLTNVFIRGIDSNLEDPTEGRDYNTNAADYPWVGDWTVSSEKVKDFYYFKKDYLKNEVNSGYNKATAYWIRALLKVEQAGDYTFSLKSGDGSRLYIGTNLVADADGYIKYFDYVDQFVPYLTGEGTIHLEEGYHLLQVHHLKNGPPYYGDNYETWPYFKLEYRCVGAGISQQEIPYKKLFLDPDDGLLPMGEKRSYQPKAPFTGLSARVTRPLDRHALAIKKEQIPESLQPAHPDKVQVDGGRWYFKELPASLGKRFYYDSLAGQLVFRGRLNDLESGDPELTRPPVQPYVLEPNFLTHEDVEILLALPGEEHQEWTEAIEQLQAAAGTEFTTGSETGLGVVAAGTQSAMAFHRELDSGDVEAEPAAFDGSDTGVGDVVPASSFGTGSALVASPTALANEESHPIYVTIAENNDSRATGAVSLHVIQLSRERYRGSIQVITPQDPFSDRINLKHTGDFGGNTAEIFYQWWVSDVYPLDQAGTPDGNFPEHWQVYAQGLGLNSIDFKGSPSITLSDKFFFVRYGALEELQEAAEDNSVQEGVVTAESWHHVLPDDPEPDWISGDEHPVPFQWVGAANSPQLQADGRRRYLPQLVMGWVKRVLDQINLYEARYSATFSGDAPATYSSMLQQAGGPYMGPVALNAQKENVENVGLIALYETVLRRAKDLTAGINATAGTDQAILLAATRLAFLYQLLGSEAFSDAQNFVVPQTEDGSTALPLDAFAFKNVVSNPLQEELALLRGTDYIKAYPAYNRLFWNYFKADGEAFYNANYNIQDVNHDGIINESDAAILYPMGHGDAWGHYLSSTKMHYELLRRPGYAWLARSEFYALLGNVLPVDYLDEKTFATIAADKVRTGSEILKATYRDAYVSDPDGQWQGYEDTIDPARAWGVSEWSHRIGQGAWFDWLAANAVTPVSSTNQLEGLDRIDRHSMLAEMGSLTAGMAEVQQILEDANHGHNPLGLDGEALVFQADPFPNGLHWERMPPFRQSLNKAIAAASNAVAAYRVASQADWQLRRIADDTRTLQEQAILQDLDYRNRLVALYGRPYEGTVGPGKIFAEGYTGPDTVTYMYLPATSIADVKPEPISASTYRYTLDKIRSLANGFDFSVNHFQATDTEEILKSFYLNADSESNRVLLNTEGNNGDITLHTELPLSEVGEYAFKAPEDWGRRPARGEIQAALNGMLAAQIALDLALEDYAVFQREVEMRVSMTYLQLKAIKETRAFAAFYRDEEIWSEVIITGLEILEAGLKAGKHTAELPIASIFEALPDNIVVGLANGGDMLSALKAATKTAKDGVDLAFQWGHFAADVVKLSKSLASDIFKAKEGFGKENIALYTEFKESMLKLSEKLLQEEPKRNALSEKILTLYRAGSNVRSLIAQAERLVQERTALNQQIAAKAQRHRYADLVTRIHRNEAMRKYDQALDHAARYAWLAVKTYDYETSLSSGHPASAEALLDQIVKTRSLGNWFNGQPMIGNGGLAEILARVSADYDALEGQIGLNNNQSEANILSLRSELMRISPTAGNDPRWREALSALRVADLWQVPEFAQYCRPFSTPDEGSQPGLVIPFSTEIAPDKNFFGHALSGLDHAFSPANYATKIRSFTVAFQNYDKDDTGSSPMLSISPRFYLVPVGLDIQYCSDTAFPTKRTWNVVSQRIPVPFVLSQQQLGDPTYQPTMNGLDGSFADRIRYGDSRAFTTDLGWNETEFFSTPLQPGWNASSRLYGRSAYNTRWLLIIPGATLSADQDAGLTRFIETVTDIKLYLETYSVQGM